MAEKVADEKHEDTKKNNVISKIKSIKHLDIFVALVVLVLVLALYFGVFSPKNREIITSDDSNATFLHDLEHVLSSIDGVGRTKIMINYDNDRSVEIAHKVESVVKVDKDGASHVIEESREPIIIRTNGEDKPIILSENNGNIKGIVVVASGGGNVKVKLSIIDALSTLLKVSPDKIKVYEMRK